MDGQKKSVRKADMTKKTTRDDRIVCSLSALSKIICRDKEEIFIGSNGKEFKLVRRFETDEEFEGYRRENWLVKSGIIKLYTDRIYFSCRRQSKQSTKCRVYCIYVKHNRSLYQNGEQHNHPMGKEYNDCFSRFLSNYRNNKKADYLDPNGRIWHFHCQIDSLEELEKCAKEQMLHGNSAYRTERQYFACKYACTKSMKRYGIPPPYCQMKAVFIKVTSSIYVRNEHSHHPAFEMKIKPSRLGKLWEKLENGKNAEKNVEHAEQNVPIPMKDEENGTDGQEEREVRIVKHLQRDYKCLGRMKREGQSRTDTECLIVQDEEDENLEEVTSQGTRGRGGTFYRYTQRQLQRSIIKKEEPEEAEEEDGHLQLQPQQAEMAQPAKMLLRERKKRINYGK